MKRLLAVCLLVACGKKPEGGGGASGSAPAPGSAAKPAGDRFAKVKQPKVSPICEKARSVFGYGAECIETELPDLASAAGKLTRVMQKGDASGRWIYALTKPDGAIVLGDGGGGGSIEKEVLKGLDTAATPPELLAKLEAALDVEVAVVRCLPGTDDKLPPDKAGKPVPCNAPAITKQGDRSILTYTIEQFPHPRLLNRDAHQIGVFKVEVKDHDVSFSEGEYVLELPVDAPLPKDAPPPPTMSTPPAWVAKPEPAADDVNKAICAIAAEKVSEMAGRQCKAFAYPSLDTPAGSLFWIANDAGIRQLLALKKPDGSYIVGFDVQATENPRISVVKNFDPKTMPAEKIAALHLFLSGEAVRLLCLPGSNDALPDDPCTAPAVEKKGDQLLVTYIVEELPFPNANGNVPDPAVRRYATELTPGGGASGGGTRLVDMREGE